METLHKYGIIDGDYVKYKSKLCSVACSAVHIEYPEISSLTERVNELVQSYLNQWQFVVSAYAKLKILFDELNLSSDVITENIFTEYDLNSSIKEQEFRDYTYLLIVSMKTFLDLMACLTDITLTQKIEDEFSLTDFYKFPKKIKKEFPLIHDEFFGFQDKDKYPWIYLLKEARNSIIHRGYQLKPIFEFKKSDELSMRIYKGMNFNSDTIVIKIGKLFDDFINGTVLIEEKVSELLLYYEKKSSTGLKVEVAFKSDGQFTEFHYSEVDP